MKTDDLECALELAIYSITYVEKTLIHVLRTRWVHEGHRFLHTQTEGRDISVFSIER